MEKQRITCVLGAGAALGFHLPSNVILPSTGNITDEVRKPYQDFLTKKDIDVVEEMYQYMKTTLPAGWNQTEPNVHFEMLFHVLEMYKAYGMVWKYECKNSDIYPIFAPFISPTKSYDVREISQIMKQFLRRIIEIVKGYDDYFAEDSGQEDWYRNFFKYFPLALDVFNFNYDTTIEQSLGEGNYEDGFELIGGEDYSQFLPRKLFDNVRGVSTINHLHGCIRYYYERISNRAIYSYDHNDLFKYQNSETVLNMMIGHSQNQGTNQTNEEIYAGPIITGLRKTDKLNCIPYDYYHANLIKSFMKNSRLIISGYSFGDLYMNQQLERMGLVHGENKRIVLIDYWNNASVEEIGLGNFLEYKLSPKIGNFLMMMCEVNWIAKMPSHLRYNGLDKPIYSDNGCVMILACGMRDAVENYSQEIYDFLK